MDENRKQRHYAMGKPSRPMAQVNAITLANVAIVEFQCASPHFNMLLGRDILCSGMFTLGFDGRFTFSI
jgi:hypothetical protein